MCLLVYYVVYCCLCLLVACCFPLRVQAGHCFHVFTKFQHDKMAEFQLPEMLRTPLEELVLQIKILNLGPALEFLKKAIEPPEEKSVQNALQCLIDLVSSCVLLWYGMELWNGGVSTRHVICTASYKSIVWNGDMEWGCSHYL